MSELETIAKRLQALGHPMRLKIVRRLASEDRDMYLNEIANGIGINRALAKIHLNKLEREGIVKSRVVLVEGEAKALRFYSLKEFDINISRNTLKEVKENDE
ncbi:MAG: helix-turn-helix domain-containing protein [Candidatus Dadabacteria bacterium]|nr:helix-turn-helix domain-containing protein [Candidatus Dadabacteria bacterium]